MPKSYGIKPGSKGRFVRWEDVEHQLIAARNYWVVTASASGGPHVVPVWGIWHSGTLYFSTHPASRTGLNLATNNRIAVHLESGDDVVILYGKTIALSDADVTDELDTLYHGKYGWNLKGNRVLRLQARTALAWSEADFTESATRWRFQSQD